MKILCTVAMVAALGFGVEARGQTTIPDVRIQFEQPTDQPVSLFCTPAGGGQALSAARLQDGTVVDATITITLLVNTGSGYEPVAQFPYEDIWIQSSSGGLIGCQSVNPDANTDAQGRTSWASPLLVGGQLDPAAGDQLYVMVNGDRMDGDVTNFLRINSADINGDGFVNLTDAAQFVEDLYGEYAYRSDFRWDGAVDLSDAGYIAAAYGQNCP